jgi:hypothetical protein
MTRLLYASFLATLLLPAQVWAQTTLPPNQGGGTNTPEAGSPANPTNHGETELNILMSYYQQDGNHSAVEGGQGTQELTDLTPTIILNVPLDSMTRVSANMGMDIYSSASTDRIDQVLSSPSSRDTRYHLDLGISRQLADKRTIVGAGAGFSKEYDYLSFNVTGSWSQASADGNRELSVAAQAFFDRATLILPVELRIGGGNEHGSGFDTRQSFNLNLVYSQVINQRLQLAVSTELVAQRGLLSTPFHRVYFQETGGAFGSAKAEVLPRQRYKYPVGLRATYYASDLVQLRSFYRFYNDNFGITAHTLELEAPVKVTPFFVLYPFYRYHTQTAADYFAPYLAPSITDEYFTSDYDLADFSANKFGLGLRYSPVYGIGRFKTLGGGITKFKSLDLRYAYYRQSTGLTANLISADLSFILP